MVTHVGIGEANLGGNGLYALANWKDGGVGYRDGFAWRVNNTRAAALALGLNNGAAAGTMPRNKVPLSADVVVFDAVS